MKELIEARLPLEWAKKNLGNEFGKRIGDTSTIKIVLPIEHPDVARLQKLLVGGPAIGKSAWFIRKYSKEELDSAEILQFKFKTIFEPEAERCNEHIYNYSDACPECGSGRTQEKPLQLDVSRLLAGKDFACTIANEWICSKKIRNIVDEEGVTGVDFARIFTCGGNREIEKWLQFIPTGKAGEMTERTQFGNDPFDLDNEGRYKCSKGHVRGLNALSEIHISRKEWDGSDIAITSDMTGLRQGVLVPTPLIIISQHFYKLLKAAKITGYEVEIAHLDL